MKNTDRKFIVLHHSATKDSGTLSWPAIRKYHKETMNWSDVGYHFGIEMYGDQIEILVGRPLHRDGAHCRERGMNHKSIGICFVGDYDSKAPHPELWDRGVELVADLCVVHNIPPNNIFGHRDFKPSKTCPGKRFNLDKFKIQVAKRVLLFVEEP